MCFVNASGAGLCGVVVGIYPYRMAQRVHDAEVPHRGRQGRRCARNTGAYNSLPSPFQFLGKGKEELPGSMHFAGDERLDGSDETLPEERRVFGGGGAAAHPLRQLRNRRPQESPGEEPKDGQRVREERGRVRPASPSNRRCLPKVSSSESGHVCWWLKLSWLWKASECQS